MTEKDNNQVTKFKDRPILITINLITLFISIMFFLFIPFYLTYNFFFNFISFFDVTILITIVREGFPDSITDKFGHPLYITARLVGALLLYLFSLIFGLLSWYNLLKYFFNKSRKKLFEYNLVALENPIIDLGYLLYFIAYFVLLISMGIISDKI